MAGPTQTHTKTKVRFPSDDTKVKSSTRHLYNKPKSHKKYKDTPLYTEEVRERWQDQPYR